MKISEEESPSYAEPKEEEEEEEEEKEIPRKSRSSTENRRNLDGEEIPDYEKQRLSRIRENRARLEALGLRTLSSSFLASVGNHPNKKSTQGKKKVSRRKTQEDDEYRPSEGEDAETSSTTEEEEEDDDGSRLSSTRKGKSKSPLGAAKLKKTLPIQRDANELDLIDDDISLQQAIALSLGGPPEELPSMLSQFSQDFATSKNDIGRSGRQQGLGVHEATQRRKRRKSNISRVQLTEDEVLAYFLSFDEARKGKITVRNLQRLAEAHDFNWTDKELIDMIDCFDSDRDGKLSLGDFRTIVAQCNMMQGSENVEIGVKN